MTDELISPWTQPICLSIVKGWHSPMRSLINNSYLCIRGWKRDRFNWDSWDGWVEVRRFRWHVSNMLCTKERNESNTCWHLSYFLFCHTSSDTRLLIHARSVERRALQAERWNPHASPLLFVRVTVQDGDGWGSRNLFSPFLPPPPLGNTHTPSLFIISFLLNLSGRAVCQRRTNTPVWFIGFIYI